MPHVVPLRLEDNIAAALNELVQSGEFVSRNDAIRAAVRQLLSERRLPASVFLERMARVAAWVISKRFGTLVSDIILYGSVARQRARLDSDIDLLVLTRNRRPSRELAGHIEDEIYDLGLAIDVVYTVRVLPRDRFRRRLQEGIGFAREVVATGQTLQGDLLDVLRR